MELVALAVMVTDMIGMMILYTPRLRPILLFAEGWQVLFGRRLL